MFIGRERELLRLSRRIQQNGFKAILIYGRRRVGKTQLVRKAIEESGLPSLTLLARDVDPRITLSEFGEEAGRFMNISGFRPRDFYELFSALMDYSSTRPFILFIDEYSFLKENLGTVDSSLQKAIELHAQGAEMTLILCGSYVDVMSRLADYDAPLYGRFSDIILLHPFDYLDAGRFFPELSDIERFRYYAVFGGIAFNLASLHPDLSFEENLIELFIEPDSLFESEAVLTVKKELEKAGRMNTIFELIARGANTYRKINEYTGGKDSSSYLYYLKRLEEMDLIDRSYSLTDTGKRKPVYRIKDRMLEFYYTFLFRNQEQRALMASEIFYRNMVKPKLETDYLPRRFEEAVKEYAIRQNGKRLPLFTDAGNLVYHGRAEGSRVEREFDLVLKTDGGYIPIECKYRNKPVSMSDVHEEMNQWRGLPFQVKRFGFASKSGFEEDVLRDDSLLLIDIEDMYRE